jgi:WD40 repeat protein
MSSRLLALPGSLVLVLLSAAGHAAEPPKAKTDLYGDPLPPGAVARMGTVRWRARYISHLGFVPGDKYLATNDGSALSFWDLRTGKVARTIRDTITPMKHAFAGEFVFTPDGKRVLTADVLAGKAAVDRREDWQPALFLWEVSSGKLLARSPDLPVEPGYLALRHDGRLAACGTHYGDVLLWEPGKKVLRPVISGERGVPWIKGLAFTRDGKHLIVAEEHPKKQSLRIDVASGKILERRDLGDFGRVAIAANDGTLATEHDSKQLVLHYPTGGKKELLPLEEELTNPDLSFSPDGRTLVARYRRAETVVFWDTGSGKRVRELHLPGLAGTGESNAGLLLSGDGKTLASIEGYWVVRVWDARTGRPRQRYPAHDRSPDRLAFSPNGKQLVSYAVEPAGIVVHHWEAATGKQVRRAVMKPPEDSPFYRDLEEKLLAPGGRHLAERFIASDAQTVHLYDTQTGKCLVLPDRKAYVAAWAFTPDGRTLATAGLDHDVRFWDTATGKLTRRLRLGEKGGYSSWIQFTPDGRSLATGEGWRKVYLWDLETGKWRTKVSLPETREPYQKPIDRWETAFSSDGRYLFASNATNLWVWDLRAGKEIGPFEEDEHEWRTIRSGYVGVSPDGRLLAWFDPGWTLCLYEIASGQIVHRFPDGHSAFRFPDGRSAFAFAPSGWRLATGCSADKSILVWDFPTLFRSQTSADPVPKADALWADLASNQASKAHRALWRLASLPEADTILADRLVPVKPLSEKRLRALLGDLGADDFATRQKAERALVQAREAARAGLVEARRGAKDLELKLRLKRLLARLQSRAGDRLREARAVMVLEARGTAKARELLRRLAAGLPEARVTQEAKSALGRLGG